MEEALNFEAEDEDDRFIHELKVVKKNLRLKTNKLENINILYRHNPDTSSVLTIAEIRSKLWDW